VEELKILKGRDLLMSRQITTFQAAVAQAALAYKLYQKKFSGPRWEALVKKGAKKQRLLWASTSVKNPAYPDTLYVAPLIGPDTVSQLIFHIS
jgi:transaldolase